MRIVSGIYRSRVLKEFKGSDIRPTSDIVRESLFNILMPIIGGNSFLDLFCGTAAVGIEAISRGADRVDFVDVSKDSVKLASENLASLQRKERPVFSDGVSYLTRTANKYGIIFLDPPYKSDLGIKALETISKTDVLKEGGIVVYENEKPFEGEIDGLEKYDERRYGRAYVTFFRRKVNE